LIIAIDIIFRFHIFAFSRHSPASIRLTPLITPHYFLLPFLFMPIVSFDRHLLSCHCFHFGYHIFIDVFIADYIIFAIY